MFHALISSVNLRDNKRIMKKSNIIIDLLNDIDVNDINANLEYNIIILGNEGKYIIKNF